MLRRLIAVIASTFATWAVCDLFGLQHEIYGYDCRDVVVAMLAGLIFAVFVLASRYVWKNRSVVPTKKRGKPRYNPLD